jgi:hypothetical protein
LLTLSLVALMTWEALKPYFDQALLAALG